MTNSEIVDALAKDGLVGELIQNICHSTADILNDLEQMIYLDLLLYDNDKLDKLYESGQIRFFLVRMITNQYYSKNSPFFTQYRKFSSMSEEINNDDNNDNDD